MLQEQRQEALHRPEQRPVDHERAVSLVVRADVPHVEALRLLKIHLEGGQLPAPADGVAQMHVDLGSVEGALALGHGVRNAARVQGRSQGLGGLVPLLEAAQVLVGPRGELGLELGHPERTQHPQHEAQQALQLGAQLLGRAEDVRVVLGHPPHPGQAVQHP